MAQAYNSSTLGGLGGLLKLLFKTSLGNMAKPHVYKIYKQVQWLTLVILVLWEAEDSGSQGHEFEISPANMVKPHLY